MTTKGTTATLDRDSARSPGKLILSGEHSVVYGAPALAVAIDVYTEVWFTPMLGAKGLRTAFDNLSQGQFYPIELIKSFKQGLDRRFDAFKRGDLTVKSILQRPDDLAIYTVASLLHYLPVPGITSQSRLLMPGLLSSRSDLPLGAGMGSSAAIIASTFVLYEHLLGYEQTDVQRFERVRFCERLQHGSGSAIDAATVVNGGLNRIENNELTKPSIDPSHSLMRGDGWYWVLHGKPVTSTGECVAAVREAYGNDQALWDAFSSCTNAFQATLERDGNPADVIKENHRLLTQIGVVPESTQKLISQVEEFGGAAKICGAGSIRGNDGGLVLVHMPEPGAMERLMANHADLRWEKLRVASEGAHIQIRQTDHAPLADMTATT